MKKYFLIYLPFLLFSLTYIYLIYYYQREKIIVPKLIGTFLSDLTSHPNNDLMFKIVKVIYNKEYEDNYIVGQYPLPGALIRPNQIISLEVNSNKNNAIKNVLYNANQSDLIALKEKYKKEGILYKVVHFNTVSGNLKKIISIYDKKKNLTYIYANIKEDKSIIYIKNILGKLCHKIINNYDLTCYALNNIAISNCSGSDIINQFPLPGVYLKNKNKIKIYIWHK